MYSLPTLKRSPTKSTKKLNVQEQAQVKAFLLLYQNRVKTHVIPLLPMDENELFKKHVECKEQVMNEKTIVLTDTIHSEIEVISCRYHSFIAFIRKTRHHV